jgi:hypothetical protein
MTDESPLPEIYWAPPGSPPPGGVPYAQPPYAQPSYAQPSYSPAGPPPWEQPSYPPSSWGQAAPPPQSHSRRKRRASIAGSAAAALAVAGVIIAVATTSGDSSPPSRHLSVPNAFGTVVLDADRSTAATALLQQTAGTTSALRRMSAHAVVGYYAHADSPAGKVTFLGLDGRDIASEYVGSADWRQGFLDGFVDSADLTDTAAFDPGPLGGSLRCGTVRGKLAVCTWIDRDTAGMTEVNSAASLDAAAQTTLELRTAAEH